MSVQREELLRLVEELPEEEVPAVLDDVRRHLRSVRERPWPPAWFGAGEGSADDVAARSEDLLNMYESLPLGTTDASVVAVTERLGLTDVATLDRRHFTVVRPRHVDALTLLP
jgi:predicted nucleic acid-binding protein